MLRLFGTVSVLPRDNVSVTHVEELEIFCMLALVGQTRLGYRTCVGNML